MILSLIAWLRNERPKKPAPQAEPDAPRVFAYVPTRAPQTTEQVQNDPIEVQMAQDVRDSVIDLRTMPEWYARIARIEWEYGKRVNHESRAFTRDLARHIVDTYRAQLRANIEQHQRRPARIYRTSRAASLA